MLDLGSGRAGRSGVVTLTYRVKFPNPDNALASRSTFRTAGSTPRGFEQFNAPVTIRRARR